MTTGAYDYLNIRSSDATKQANAYRDKAETRQARDAVCMKSYREGEAIAFLDAAKLVKEELQRLRNDFQNGALTLDSFKVPW